MMRINNSSSQSPSKYISVYQFTCFRILFGSYLVWHFLCLIPHAEELFSKVGTYADSSLSPTAKIFPNFLHLIDSSTLGIQIFLSTLSLLGLLIATGFYRRVAAFILWYAWACLINRNPLISNPSIPYVGLILLCFALIPPGEPFSKGSARQKQDWYFPLSVYILAWLLLAIGYTFSGLLKLNSPSWVDGSAMIHLVSNPLARPGIFRDLFLSLPPLLTSVATYFSLAGEILFLPLCLSRKTRLIAWLWMCLMHIGILCMVAFADLTLGMLLIHLFIFDPDWVPPRSDKKGKIIVLFDGVCGLCDRAVTLLLDEDKAGILRFSSLQGEFAKKFVDSQLESIIVIDDYQGQHEEVLESSTAVFCALDAIGGFWRIVALLRFIPRPIRDWVYQIIARNRYAWFGKLEACRMVTSDLQDRFIN